MRSHSTLQIFAIDSSRRTRPNCALSLATASAFSRTAKSYDDIPAVAMDVDVDPASSEVKLSTWKIVDGVPFPSDSGKSPRKHALLRSSATLTTSVSANPKCGRDPSESGTTEHQPPPRKRTRTSAILQPPIKSQRAPRVQSLPMRSLPSRPPRSASSLLFLPRTKELVPPKPAEESFTYAFPSSSMPTVMPQSALLVLISRLITPSDPGMKMSIPSSRRRKPLPGGIFLLRNLYKSVVYGLAMKYSVADPLQETQVSQGTSRNMARSPFDIQDALLADRLRSYLALHGEDIDVITFEIEKMGGHRTESPSLSASLQGAASSANPILPYGCLVSFILLQKRSEGRSKMCRKGTDRSTCRKPSKLTQSLTVD